MNLSFLYDLADHWEAIGDCLSEYGPDESAECLENAARDLREAVRRGMNEPLTLQEAAEESGYSRDRLGTLVRDGKLPNAGEPGSPRIRRRDLPRKPGHGGWSPDEHPATESDSSLRSREQMARSVVESDRRRR